MNDLVKSERELQLLEDNLKWLIDNHVLSESAESHYRSYIDDARKVMGTDLTQEAWNPLFNRRAGASAIRGTHSELLFEALCYLAGLKIEERVSDKKRQVYGEDFVVQARKVSVKTRKHLAGIHSEHIEGSTYSIQGDTNVYLYREDFRPAIWRVDILALVDPDTRTVTTIDYPSLARMYCTVDGRGFCTPTFTGEKILVSLHEYSERKDAFVTTRNLTVDVKERNAKVEAK